MDKSRLLISGVLASAFICIAVTMLLVLAEGCATVTVDIGVLRERRYDPNNGVEKADILKHYNLHRGRWWNYYDRGTIYLAYGHHQEALDDFDAAIGKRDSDRRDARTYGMHFIDYFPHRESGVAYYFKGQSETDDNLKAGHYLDAIAELETSLRQAESARAKFYLNEARKARWQFTKEDTTAPTIRTARPIYAKRRTVRFDVVVTDDDSHVADIRIEQSVGDVRIRTPRLLIDLAEKKITRTAEVTLGLGQKYAVVAITASDLAGNVSKPQTALIVLDKRAPTAGIGVVRDKQLAGGLVALSIEARDDFGLRQIEVGDDPTASVDCEGKRTYSGTVAGLPKGGKLTVTLVDNAGNRTVASIPVQAQAQQARLAEPLPQKPWRLLYAGLFKAGIQSPALSLAHFDGLGIQLAQSPLIVPHAAETHVLSLAAASRAERFRGPMLIFESHVKPPSGKPKETCEDTFIVEGRLRNPRGITSIAVQLKEQLEKIDVESSQPWHAFSLPVSLTDVPIGEKQIVKVEARVGPDTYLTETLELMRVEDVRRQDDATYGILLLPLSLSPESNIAPSKRSAWDVSMLSEIYEHVFKEFESLTMSTRCPAAFGQDIGLGNDETLKAFRVYHVSDVYGIAGTEALKRRADSEVTVVRDLRSWRRGERRGGSGGINPTGVDPNLIDLVVFGNVKVDNVKIGDGEDVAIKLRAVDVTSDAYLRFPIGDRDRSGVLTDATYRRDREENRRAAVKILALSAAAGIPRLCDDVEIGDDNRTIRFELGRTDRVFHHMKLWLYEKDAVRNAKLAKVDCLDLEDFDSTVSRIRCGQGQLTCRWSACYHVVITK